MSAGLSMVLFVLLSYAVLGLGLLIRLLAQYVVQARRTPKLEGTRAIPITQQPCHDCF